MPATTALFFPIMLPDHESVTPSLSPPQIKIQQKKLLIRAGLWQWWLVDASWIWNKGGGATADDVTSDSLTNTWVFCWSLVQPWSSNPELLDLSPVRTEPQFEPKKKKTQWRLQESFNSMIILNHNLDLNPTYFILSDSGQEVKYFQFPGELLMRMLKMLILPLVVSRWSLLLIFLLTKGLEFKALIGQMMFSDIFDQQQLRPCWHSFTDAGQRQEMFELKVKQRV